MHMKRIPVLIRQNMASGLVVFLVALPLCLGISLASGAPPLSGIISGIVGGIVVGYLSASHLSVAGPAAGLTSIVAMAITQLGSFELLLSAVFIAGFLQFLLGKIKAGSVTDYIPNAVIEGMLAGIGILIILKQIPAALGGGVVHFTATGITLDLHISSIAIATISLIVLILWELVPFLSKIKWLPAALVIIVLSVLINSFIRTYSPELALPADQLVQLPSSSFADLINFPDFRGFFMPETWTIAATMTIVASTETLLSLEATDRLDKHKRISDSNQELCAQGTGNMIAGLLGGLPITAVVVRSSVNANAGATHKTSAIIHGVLLFFCILAIPALLNKIPLAALAAVLFVVGYKLARPSLFMRYWKKGIYQFIPFLATVIFVIILDLLKGVAVGLVISMFYILKEHMRRAYYLSKEELEKINNITLEFSEEVSFLNKAAIKKTLKNVRPDSTILINAERTKFIADDILELVEDFANVYAKENNIHVILKGFKSDYDNENVENKNAFIHIEHDSAK